MCVCVCVLADASVSVCGCGCGCARACIIAALSKSRDPSTPALVTELRELPASFRFDWAAARGFSGFSGTEGAGGAGVACFAGVAGGAGGRQQEPRGVVGLGKERKKR